MPPKKVQVGVGMDKMRADLQECWINPNSK